MKKVELKTMKLQEEADKLKATLKEKETMYRITKFKLNELKRNIKHTQLKPLDTIKPKEPLIVADKINPTNQQVMAGLKNRASLSPR